MKSIQQFTLLSISAVCLACVPSVPAAQAFPAPVVAPTAGPPVEIDECKLLYSGDAVAGVSSGVLVKFTNDGAVPADLVTFKVSAAGETALIRDVGTFTPGIEITHHYREGSGHPMFSPLLDHVVLSCSIASVHFKDGSVWPTPPAPAKTDRPN